MSANTLENSVGEQSDRGVINDSEPLNPLLRAIASTVRGKDVPVGCIQIAINFLKELL